MIMLVPVRLVAPGAIVPVMERNPANVAEQSGSRALQRHEGAFYYSSIAGRVLVSNAGIIAVIAVGRYFFPAATTAGVACAVVTRSATWLTKEIDRKYHVHIADAIDGLLSMMPTSVGWAYGRAACNVAIPVQEVRNAIANDPRLSWINESLASELMAPLLEEAIYRFSGQKGLAWVLMRLGVPSGTANLLSGLMAAPLFAGGHNADPKSGEHRELLIAGIAFGFMMYMHNLPDAVVAHAANNFCVRLDEALQSWLSRLQRALVFP